jgi:hypothetical protein
VFNFKTIDDLERKYQEVDTAGITFIKKEDWVQIPPGAPVGLGRASW